MDPTTTAHSSVYIAPATLVATAQPDGFPVLAANPAVPPIVPTAVPLPADAPPRPSGGTGAVAPGSNNPFTHGSPADLSGSAGTGGGAGGDKADVRAQFEAALSTAQTKVGEARADPAGTAASARDAAADTAASARDSAAGTAASVRDSAADTAGAARAKLDDVRADPGAHAERAKASAVEFGQKATGAAGEQAHAVRQRAGVLGSKAGEAVDKTRQHPAVQNAVKTAQGYVQQLRDALGRSKTMRELESRTNVDRVYLVVGGALLFAMLVPLNLFGLALPTTTLLAVAPAAYLALEVLDQGASADDVRVKALLSYFVVLGFIQLLESLAAGVLERRIPHYYTLKLAFLAYLLHPQTKGSLKVYDTALRPAVAQGLRAPAYNPSTPPTSNPHVASVTSPAPVITKADARGQAFDVVAEKQPLL